MKKQSKAYKTCKTAFYRWAYLASCLEYLNQNGISKRRFKKWYLNRVALKSTDGRPVYTKEDCIKSWKLNIQQLG